MQDRNQLIISNMHIVRIIARQYYIQSYLREDLEQEGYLGLIVAADHYDPSCGVRFDSYAVWWVRRYIGRAILEYSQTVRLPQRGTPEPIYTEALDKTIAYDDDEALTYEDFLADPASADTELLRQEEEAEFARQLSLLSPRELEILNLRFGLNGDPMSMSEIAQRLCLSTDRVMKISQTTIRNLRKL